MTRGPSRGKIIGLTAGWRLLIVTLAALMVLSGCGFESSAPSEREGPKFAGDNRATVAAPTATVAAPKATEKPITAPTEAPTVDISLRGAPQFAYVSMGDRLYVFDTGTNGFLRMDTPESMRVLDFAGSPTGDRVGILADMNGTTIVQFFGADGAPLGDPVDIPTAPVRSDATPKPESATPIVTERARQMSVSWVPQGNAVLIATPDGLIRVSMSGNTTKFADTGVEGEIVQAVWSPMDSEIALLERKANTPDQILVIEKDHGAPVALEDSYAPADQGLADVQWLPNGLGLVAVSGKLSDGVVMNGQLLEYKIGDSHPRLITTSGQGGPEATIGHAIVSPDGHSVAYAIMVRDLHEWHLHSLWIKPLKEGSAVSVPVNSGSPIISLSWTATGLLWQQADGTIWLLGADGKVQELSTHRDEATPGASPAATPN